MILRISDIELSADIQPRAQTDWLTASEYAADMKAGDEFPPVVVFHDGTTYWLADGFHRIIAAKEYAGLTEFPADVRQGSKRDAAWFALGANKDRGLRLTNADKKRIVEMALSDPVWAAEKSNVEIARHCGVSHKTVSTYRNSIFVNYKDQGLDAKRYDVRKFNRNGKTYEMNTANIGKRKPPTDAAPELPLPTWAAPEESAPAIVQATVQPKAAAILAPPEPDDLEQEYDVKCDDKAGYTDIAPTPAAPTPAPPTPAPPLPQPISRIAIINADSQRLSSLAIDPVHLVITSPPYNVGIDYDIHTDDLSTYIPFVTAVWRECYKVMTDGARIAVIVPFGVGRNPYIPFDGQIMQTLIDAGFTLRGRIVWDKNTTGNRTSWGSFRLPSDPGLRDTTEAVIVAHKGQSGLEIPAEHKQRDGKGTYTGWLADSDYFMSLAQDHWVVAPESAQRVKHPAPFPVELVNRLVHFYAYPGAHILDPFAGSGTVGVAAQGLGCNATLVEISRAYCELAKARLNL